MYVEYSFKPDEIKTLFDAGPDPRFVTCSHCKLPTVIGQHIVIENMPWCLTCAIGKGVIDKEIEEEW